MNTQLKCENPANQSAALKAFIKEMADGGQWAESETYSATFEHGQIWILAHESGRIWAVNDAEDNYGDFYWDFESIN